MSFKLARRQLVWAAGCHCVAARVPWGLVSCTCHQGLPCKATAGTLL